MLSLLVGAYALLVVVASDVPVPPSYFATKALCEDARAAVLRAYQRQGRAVEALCVETGLKP